MKYRNAADILPKELLTELQRYAEGEILYVPRGTPKTEWGAKTGSRAYYEERNQEIPFPWPELIYPWISA